jgi:hypothetical protein
MLVCLVEDKACFMTSWRVARAALLLAGFPWWWFAARLRCTVAALAVVILDGACLVRKTCTAAWKKVGVHNSYIFGRFVLLLYALISFLSCGYQQYCESSEECCRHKKKVVMSTCASSRKAWTYTSWEVWFWVWLAVWRVLKLVNTSVWAVLVMLHTRAFLSWRHKGSVWLVLVCMQALQM